MASKQKKGQVTLFAIVGAVILLAAILVFFISKEVTEDKPGIKEPEVSLEARPAMELIERCLEQTAGEAIVKIGQQGGALTILPSLAKPSYRGEAVEFSPYIVPFWRHLENCNNPSGCEASCQYPLCSPASENCFGVLSGDDSIEKQIEDYVTENVGTCINEFTGISEVYDLELIGEPEADVYFGSGQTTVVLSYPTRISSHSSQDMKIVDDYIVTFDVDLLAMYEFAEEIIDFEREYNYYEHQTMNFVTAYSGIDAALPPVGEMDLSSNEKIWVQPEIKQILQYDLLPFMNFVRFANTANGERIYQREDLGEYTLFAQGMYDALLPKTSNTLYPYEVTHQYTYDDIMFAIDGGDILIRPDDILSDSVMMDFIGSVLPGIKDYRFGYHISYPLIIKIHDPEAMNGEGYDFQFAVEVNVRNNEPAYQNFTYADFSTPLDISLASYQLRLPQEITIATFDQVTGEPLEDVIISYICGDEYVIGQTKRDGAKTTLTTTMPYCELGGYIKYEAFGYLGESYAYNNRVDNPNQYFEFDLWPVVDKEIVILTRSQNNTSSLSGLGTEAIFEYETSASALNANQTVFFNLNRLPATPYDSSVPRLSFLNYRVVPPVPFNFEDQLVTITSLYEQGTINYSVYEQTKETLLLSADLTVDYAVEIPEHYFMELAPGNYSVEAYLIDETNLFIPNKTISINDPKWYAFWEAEKSTMLPSMNFSSWPSGGAVFTFEITPAMLYSLADRPLTFYVLEQPLPTSWDILENYLDPEEYQIGKERWVQPTI